jgi:hypothetical protein
MTYHFVNILTWKFFIRPIEGQKIYVDGFLLKLLIYLKTRETVEKRSGLNFYHQRNWDKETLFLTRDGKGGFAREFPLENWSSNKDIIISQDLYNAVVNANDIVIGISSTKQDTLAYKIKLVNPNANVYCLGAAIYSTPLLKSESIVNTLGSMLVSNPKRTLNKLVRSINTFLLDFIFCKNDLKRFMKSHFERN